jgi:hypothetical protein
MRSMMASEYHIYLHRSLVTALMSSRSPTPTPAPSSHLGEFCRQVPIWYASQGSTQANKISSLRKARVTASFFTAFSLVVDDFEVDSDAQDSLAVRAMLQRRILSQILATGRGAGKQGFEVLSKAGR